MRPQLAIDVTPRRGHGEVGLGLWGATPAGGKTEEEEDERLSDVSPLSPVFFEEGDDTAVARAAAVAARGGAAERTPAESVENEAGVGVGEYWDAAQHGVDETLGGGGGDGGRGAAPMTRRARPRHPSQRGKALPGGMLGVHLDDVVKKRLGAGTATGAAGGTEGGKHGDSAGTETALDLAVATKHLLWQMCHSRADMSLIVVAIMLFLTVASAAYAVTASVELRLVEEEFIGTTTAVATLAEQEMTKHVDDMVAFSSMFARSERQEAVTLQAYGDATTSQQVGRGALLWAPYVHSNDTDLWEKHAERMLETTNVSITAGFGDSFPADHEMFFPVLYASSVVIQEDLTGRDFSVDSVRGSAARHAFWNETFTSSARIALVRSGTFGVFAAAPVIKEGSKTAGSHANFTSGLILTSIELGSVLETAFATDVDTAGLEAYLVDVTNDVESAVYLHALDADTLEMILVDDEEIANIVEQCSTDTWCRSSRIQFGTRTWETVIVATHTYRDRAGHVSLLVVSIVGAMNAIVLVLAIVNIVHRRREEILKADAIHHTHQNIIDFICHELRNPLHCVSVATAFAIDRVQVALTAKQQHGGLEPAGRQSPTVPSGRNFAHALDVARGMSKPALLSADAATPCANRPAHHVMVQVIDELSRELLEDLKIVRANVASIRSVVHDIVDVTRFQYAHFEVDLTQGHRVRDLIGSVVNTYQESCLIPIRKRISHRVPEYLRFDLPLLRQVLVLGVHNAVKYASAEAAQIVVSARLIGSYVFICVVDSNTPEQPQATLSSSPHQATLAGTNYSAGGGCPASGLGQRHKPPHTNAREKSLSFGLGLAQRIAAQHEGEVGFDQHLREGYTRFWFTFRLLCEDADARHSQPSTRTSGVSGPLRSHKHRSSNMHLESRWDSMQGLQVAPDISMNDFGPGTGRAGGASSSRSMADRSSGRAAAAASAAVTAALATNEEVMDEKRDDEDPEAAIPIPGAHRTPRAGEVAGSGTAAGDEEPGSQEGVELTPRRAQGPSYTRPAPVLAMSDLTIWIVDDEPMNRKLLQRMLLKLGVREEKIVAMEDGQDLVRRAQERADHIPHNLVILCDIVMQRMNGDVAVAKVREDPRWAHTPILASTGDSRAENHALYVSGSVGFTSVMTKPFSMKTLKAAVLGLATAAASAAARRQPPPLAAPTPTAPATTPALGNEQPTVVSEAPRGPDPAFATPSPTPTQSPQRKVTPAAHNSRDATTGSSPSGRKISATSTAMVALADGNAAVARL